MDGSTHESAVRVVCGIRYLVDILSLSVFLVLEIDPWFSLYGYLYSFLFTHHCVVVCSVLSVGFGWLCTLLIHSIFKNSYHYEIYQRNIRDALRLKLATETEESEYDVTDYDMVSHLMTHFHDKLRRAWRLSLSRAAGCRIQVGGVPSSRRLTTRRGQCSGSLMSRLSSLQQYYSEVSEASSSTHTAIVLPMSWRGEIILPCLTTRLCTTVAVVTLDRYS